MKRIAVLLLGLAPLLTGCSHHAPPDPRLSDSIMVISKLNDQLDQWYGTPYRYGGLSASGLDCSGFVYLTFRDRFAIMLPRTTEAQTDIGSRVDRDALLPGDLVFFKTGSGRYGLHVGIYATDNKFIHASTSRGVIRSSLVNSYWRKTYWQARRI
ncbi:endopeptidase [Sodalis-like symbiont of Bactericera trigonica]|nr:endopeptidase [Sodalis-like symbiont of Bactericera trigonica]